MISRKDVCLAIDRSADDYRAVWATLAAWKSREATRVENVGLQHIQPRLAEAIFRVSRLRHEIGREKRRLIDRKPFLSAGWFNRRMQLVDQYQTALLEAAQVGRALGDAFVWPILQKDTKLAAQHLSHPAQPAMPGGTGGRGELELAKGIQLCGDFLVLHHCITSVLRIGDISLLDPKTGQLTAIGELKTQRLGPGKINCSISIVATTSDLPKQIRVPKTWRQSDQAVQLQPPAEARLGRQLERMRETVSIKPHSLPRHDLTNAYHTDAFADLASDLARSRTSFQQAGGHLLLVGIREPRQRRLSTRLLATPDVSSAHVGLPEATRRILVPGADNNLVFVNTIDPTSLAGGTPLFWWPFESDFLERVLFKQILVLTVYNCGPLLQLLREKGFQASYDRTRRAFSITEKTGRGTVVLGSFGYFVNQIQCHLMKEESVLHLVDLVLNSLPRKQPKRPTRIELNIQPQLVDWSRIAVTSQREQEAR